MEHPAAREPQQVVFADGLRGDHRVAVEALRHPLGGEPGLGRLDPDQRVPGEGRREAAGVAVAHVTLGHRPTISASRGGGTDWRKACPPDRLAG